MATIQKRRNGRRNNQEETPNKLKKKNSKTPEQNVAIQDETPVSNVLVPVELEEKIKPKNNGIPSPPSLQNEQASTPLVAPNKKTNTPRKRKANKQLPVKEIPEVMPETTSADQPVIEEKGQPILIIKKEKGSS